MENSTCLCWFGLSPSDTINSIIAVFAALGFIASLTISIVSLKQTQNALKKQTNISLFDQRLEVYKYFAIFFTNEYLLLQPPKDTQEFYFNVLKVYSLFPDSKELFVILTKLCDHYLNDKPFPYGSSIGTEKQKREEIRLNIKKGFDKVLNNLLVFE